VSCPGCHRLIHADKLEALSAKARAATAAGDLAGARLAWEEALPLLPPDSVQFATIRQTIAALATQISSPPPPKPDAGGTAKKGLGALGVIGAMLFKFKTVLLLIATKGKLLLLGLTKMSTLLSMFASMGVYWALYGWKFAAGFIISIYIHEMGHVAALARFGIPATPPMFIPMFGAVVRLKAYPANAGEDARVGLAGPLYGLGAAIAAAGMFLLTGSAYWAAIARVGAWINLFNLIPVWQLDGARGFHALTRVHRMIVIGVAGVLWFLTSEVMLLLIPIAGVFKLFGKDIPEKEDDPVLFQFVGILAALAVVYLIAARA
jgi:Zn-dependent protease